MKRLLQLVLAALLLASTSSWAAPARGTADEAVAMVKRVAGDIKKHGRQKVIQDVQNQDPRYRDRDLYVFVASMDGITLANGGNPKLAGKNLNDIKDADGKAMGRERFDIARTKGQGWQGYRWPDPLSGEVRRKAAYLERHDDLIISCGVYKD